MLDFFQILNGVTGVTGSGGSVCSDYGSIIGIVKGILGIIQFAIPILLIIMGSIDLGKAVMSSDEKEIKGASTKLMKRAIAAIAVFLVSALVNLIMNMVAKNTSGAKKDSEQATFLKCWHEISTGDANVDGNQQIEGIN
jgi:hypothetical protein